MILGHFGDVSSLNFTEYSTVVNRQTVFGKSKVDDKAKVFHDTNRHILFIASGRVDNKKELEPYINKHLCDAAYIFEAYKKWGKNCVNHILGDWIFAASDTQTQELFIARDQNGTPTLFFRKDDNGFIFSSSIVPLLQIQKDFNIRYALGIMTLWKFDAIEETIFESIYRLPGGHTLTYKNKQIKIEKYWHPEKMPLRIYNNTQDYADELLEITKEAVRCRIEGVKSVCSMLSGGLDSGTVSVLAAELLGANPITTFSHVPLFINNEQNYPNSFDDETDFINATAGKRNNIQSVKLKTEYISPLEGLSSFIDNYHTIMHGACNAFWLIDISQQATQLGFDIMLSGQCGNTALSYTGLERTLPFNFHKTYQSLKDKLAKPLLKNWIEYRRFKQYISKGYINGDVIEDFNVKNDVLKNRTGFKTIFRSSQEEIVNLLNIFNRHHITNPGEINLTEIRDPTADIRLIEYCLSIPNKHFFNENRENKQVLRRMMAGRLPDKVLYEKKKGLQASDIFHRLYIEKEHLSTCFNEYQKKHTFRYLVDCKKLEQDIQLFKSNRLKSPVQINQILKTIMLGMFLEKQNFH